jgi:hypothetical protein
MRQIAFGIFDLALKFFGKILNSIICLDGAFVLSGYENILKFFRFEAVHAYLLQKNLSTIPYHCLRGFINF